MSAKRTPKGTEWLKEFGLVPEEAMATMLGISVEALRNRPLSRQPAFFKDGRRRLYRADSVREFIERNTKSAA